MRRTEVLQGLRKMKFEDVFGRWQARRLSQAAAAIPGMSERTFRRWRDRYDDEAAAGLLLHQDGSAHRWLPALDRALDLSVTLDDATSEIHSAFLVEEESTQSSFQALAEVIAQLGIEHIPAYSPEARGRSERAFGTLQDRLVKELALAGISTLEAANRLIEAVHVPEHNARFAIAPEHPETAFVADAAGAHRDILRIQDERMVGNDNTVRHRGLALQIPPSPLRPHLVKARVRVHAYPAGTLALFHGPRRLARYRADGRPLDHDPLLAA